jgi:DNA-binding MarR family transcriptional regulator
VQTPITCEYLKANRELIDLSMRFAKLSNQKRDVLKTLAENDNATNKEIATILGITENTVSATLFKLRSENWIDSKTVGRHAFWFFVDNEEKNFIKCLV